MSFGPLGAVMLLEIGDVLVSMDAGTTLNHSDIDTAIERHIRGEWGELDTQSWAWNNSAVENGYGVVSVHLDRELNPFFVMTNAERDETLVMLPHEY